MCSLQSSHIVYQGTYLVAAVGGCRSVRIDGWISILLYRFSICACVLYLGNLTTIGTGECLKTPLLFSENYIYHCIHLSIHHRIMDVFSGTFLMQDIY